MKKYKKTILERITGRDDHKKYCPIVNPILGWVLGIPEKKIDEESVYDLAMEIENELEKYLKRTSNL
jgi:hypothetical protein